MLTVNQGLGSLKVLHYFGMYVFLLLALTAFTHSLVFGYKPKVYKKKQEDYGQ